MRQGVRMDGEFYLRVKSRILQVCRPCHRTFLNLSAQPGVFPTGSHLLCRHAQVYCADMHTDDPKEYVTLRSGQMDNYSEVYGHRLCVWRGLRAWCRWGSCSWTECSCVSSRLLNPFECPYNGSRRQNCNCRNDYAAAGYTLFHKVRLDLSSLRIMSALVPVHGCYRAQLCSTPPSSKMKYTTYNYFVF